MNWSDVRKLKSETRKDKTASRQNKYILEQRSKYMYRNKNYPVAKKVKFIMSDKQERDNWQATQQGNIGHNKEKNPSIKTGPVG